MTTTSMMFQRIGAAALCLGFAACSDDPQSHSAPVGIVLSVKGKEVVAGKIVSDKSINTESGNPFGAFVSAAQKAIGKAPSRIELSALTLTVSEGAAGAAKLGEIFDGACKVNFVMNSSNTVHQASTRTMAAADGVGPVSFTADFDTAGLTEADAAAFLGGSFKVALDCGATAAFASSSADAKLTATMTFAAYE